MKVLVCADMVSQARAAGGGSAGGFLRRGDAMSRIHDNNREECPWNDPEMWANPATHGLDCRCPETIKAPWDAATTIGLNRIQCDRNFHPYTCGKCRTLLVATSNGWICPAEDCDYTQDWAHPVPSWLMAGNP